MKARLAPAIGLLIPMLAVKKAARRGRHSAMHTGRALLTNLVALVLLEVLPQRALADMAPAAPTQKPPETNTTRGPKWLDRLETDAICSLYNRYYADQGKEIIFDPCDWLRTRHNFRRKYIATLRDMWEEREPSTKQERNRFKQMAANQLYIYVENKRQNNYRLALNEFGAMSPDEFAETHTGFTLNSSDATPQAVGRLLQAKVQPEPEKSFSQRLRRRLFTPSAWDWDEQNGTSPVLNQGSCQSCWTFTIVTAIEGAWKRATGQLVQLSPQQFLDCTYTYDACRIGGDLVTPIQKVAQSADLCTHADYPYSGHQGQCRTACQVAIRRGAVINYMSVSNNNAAAMKAALYEQGPVAVGIHGTGNQLMFYSSGVLVSPCPNSMDHAVTVVGYGHDGLDYWKIKNSWGTGWGEHGYFRLRRVMIGPGDLCIKMIPTVPVLASEHILLGMMDNSTDFTPLHAPAGRQNVLVPLVFAAVALMLCGGFMWYWKSGLGRSSGRRKGRGVELESDSESEQPAQRAAE